MFNIFKEIRKHISLYHVTSFDFDLKAIDVLDKLKDNLRLSSRADVMRYALALLHSASEAELDGGGLYFKKDGKYQQVIVNK